MLTILVAVLLVAFITLAVRFIVRLPGSPTTKLWLGVGGGLALVGWFVVLTALYAKLDLPFRSKLRLYALTRSANPDLTGGYSPVIMTLDAKYRPDGLDIIKVADDRRAAYVNVFEHDRVRLGTLANDNIVFDPNGETRVGGWWWIYTDRSVFEVRSSINN